MSKFEQTRDKLIESIDKAIHRSTDDKAMMQLKYDRLNFKNNFVQISVIFVSTLITFVETLKGNYDIDKYAGILVPIIASTYIGLVVAIIRFLKYDDKRENMANIIERFSYIINKYKKTKHDFKYFDYNEESKKEWENMVMIYHTETYDYYNQTRELYDNAMTFSEKVYYKSKLKLLHIDSMFNDRDHSNIAQNRDIQHRQHVRKSGCLKKDKDYYTILDKFDSISEEPIKVVVREIKKDEELEEHPVSKENHSQTLGVNESQSLNNDESSNNNDNSELESQDVNNSNVSVI